MLLSSAKKKKLCDYFYKKDFYIQYSQVNYQKGQNSRQDNEHL